MGPSSPRSGPSTDRRVLVRSITPRNSTSSICTKCPTDTATTAPTDTPARSAYRRPAEALSEGTGALFHAHHVNHEYQRVATADTRLGHAACTVSLGRWHAEHHPRADGLSDEAFIPPGDHHAHPDREGNRFAAVIRGVEHRTAPGLAEIVDDDGVAGLDRGPRAFRQDGDLKFARWCGVGEGQRGLFTEGTGGGG